MPLGKGWEAKSDERNPTAAESLLQGAPLPRFSRRYNIGIVRRIDGHGPNLSDPERAGFNRCVPSDTLLPNAERIQQGDIRFKPQILNRGHGIKYGVPARFDVINDFSLCPPIHKIQRKDNQRLKFTWVRLFVDVDK